jgi:GT2 family glycosyltransferase
MSHPRVAIVILNWNGRTFLQKFLPSVIMHTPSWANLVVADNASTDDSLVFLKTHYPQIRVIELHDNYGYAGGYNLALKQVEAEYYVLLNSDIEVTPRYLEPLVDFLENNKQVAAVQPKLLSWHQRDYFEYAGASGGFIDLLGFPLCRGRILNVLEKDNGQYNDTTEIFWATGACLFVRAEAFWQAGGFDQKFFAHFEEIDLCWRLKNLGHQLMVVPQSVVYHVGGATLPKNNPFKTFLNFRNSLWCLAKNMPARYFYPLLPIRLSLDVAAAFVFLLKGQGRDFVAVLKAHFALFARLVKLRKQNRTHRIKLPSGMFRGSIVFSRFFAGIKVFSKLNSKKMGF